MPKATKKEFTLVPEGQYKFRSIGIRLHEGEKFIWDYELTCRKEGKNWETLEEPLAYSVFTGSNYGYVNALLTQHINMICNGDDWYEHFDGNTDCFEDLEGDLKIRHVEVNGKTYANIVSMNVSDEWEEKYNKQLESLR
jgi:hypothetical protein